MSSGRDFAQNRRNGNYGDRRLEALNDSPIVSFLMDMAYEPMMVYGAIVVLLVASSFGLPFPEEITLLSAGLLAHIGANPELYPPPTPDAQGVNTTIAATVCFVSVLGSDLLVFALGRHFGTRLLKTKLISKIMTESTLAKIHAWTQKVGPLACGVFRFTPGLRFPGHFACGTFGISYRQFLLVDGTAALLTVPTQVVLMAYFGKEVLGVLKEVKIVVGVLIAIGIVLYFFHFRKKRKEGNSTDLPVPASADPTDTTAA